MLGHTIPDDWVFTMTKSKQLNSNRPIHIIRRRWYWSAWTHTTCCEGRWPTGRSGWAPPSGLCRIQFGPNSSSPPLCPHPRRPRPSASFRPSALCTRTRPWPRPFPEAEDSSCCRVAGWRRARSPTPRGRPGVGRRTGRSGEWPAGTRGNGSPSHRALSEPDTPGSTCARSPAAWDADGRWKGGSRSDTRDGRSWRRSPCYDCPQTSLKRQRRWSSRVHACLSYLSDKQKKVSVKTKQACLDL